MARGLVVALTVGCLIPGIAIGGAGSSHEPGNYTLCDQGTEVLARAWEAAGARDQKLSPREFHARHDHDRAAAMAAAGDRAAMRAELDRVGPDSPQAAAMLGTAAAAGDIESIAMLVDAGVSPDGLGDTRPLIQAAACGQREAVTELLDLGADPHAQGPQGQDAMVSVLFNGDVDLAEVLISHGYDPCANRLDDGRTVAELAGEMTDKGNAGIGKSIHCD